MKTNRALINLLFLLVILVAYQLFKIHVTLRKEYTAIKVAEKYHQSLSHYHPEMLHQFATKKFLKDLEIQAHQSQVFNTYLDFYKKDKENYPINVLNLLFQHMATYTSPPNAIIINDSTLTFELQVGGSSPAKIRFCFENKKDVIRLDRVSNLHLFFEKLDCKRNEWLVAGTPTKKQN